MNESYIISDKDLPIKDKEEKYIIFSESSIL